MATETKILIDAIWYIDQAIGSISILQNMLDARRYRGGGKYRELDRLTTIMERAQLQLEKQARRLENKAIRRRLL